MRRDDCDQRLQQQNLARHGIFAMLALVAGVLTLCAGVTTRASDVTGPPAVASQLDLTAASAAVPEATIVHAVTQVGHLATSHPATFAVTALSLLLPPILRTYRQRTTLVAITPRRLRCATPRRRGPPAFLAR